MVYKQSHAPVGAVTVGSVWLCPHGSFKRVLSRGGAWENCNPGSKHPDEQDHEGVQEYEQSSQPETEQRLESTEVPLGSGESAPGNGDNGETVSEPSGEQQENTGVIHPAVTEPVDLSGTGTPIAPEGEGFDGNGSPVV